MSKKYLKEKHKKEEEERGPITCSELTEPNTRYNEDSIRRWNTFEGINTWREGKQDMDTAEDLSTNTQPSTSPSASSFMYIQTERRDSNESSSSNKSKKREGKDEKLAKEKGLTNFISTHDIINLPMDEFNDALDKAKQLGMIEEQVMCARDIRRRGKNKNAAQNCRKRANERLHSLERKVKNMKVERDERRQKFKSLSEEHKNMLELHKRQEIHILQELKCNPTEWMLENTPNVRPVKKEIPMNTFERQESSHQPTHIVRPEAVRYRIRKCVR